MQHWDESDYCTYVGDDGRKCRALKVPTRDVCIAHWRHDGQFIQDPAAAAELASLATSMKTSRGINRFLSALVRLTAEDRVSPRKGTLLAYQAQLALYALGRPARQRRIDEVDESLTVSQTLSAVEGSEVERSLVEGGEADRPAAKPNGHHRNGDPEHGRRAKPNGSAPESTHAE